MAVRQKSIEHPTLGKVVLRKSSRARRMTITIKGDGTIRVSVPYFVSFDAGLRFLEDNADKVLAAIRRREETPSKTPVADPSEVEQVRAEAKAILPARVAELAERYGFTFSSVRIKHNSSNWGSCSTKGNINLNLGLARLPRLLQDSVIIHELCHLRHLDHGEEFHRLQESLCRDDLDRLIAEGDQYALEFSQWVDGYRAAHRSSAPLFRFLERRLKDYSLI